MIVIPFGFIFSTFEYLIFIYTKKSEGFRIVYYHSALKICDSLLDLTAVLDMVLGAYNGYGALLYYYLSNYMSLIYYT